MPLPDILFSWGFGTRRVCVGLVQQDFLAVASVPCTEQAMKFVAEEMNFTVQRGDWKYHEKSCLILHRPPGCKCSQKPVATRAFPPDCRLPTAGAGTGRYCGLTAFRAPSPVQVSRYPLACLNSAGRLLA